jgi:hypothetical protein
MTVTPGQPLLDLVRSGVLLLKLNVPSRWTSGLKIDQDFEVTVDETGKTYPARVQRINSRIDPVSQTIELEAAMLRPVHPGPAARHERCGARFPVACADCVAMNEATDLDVLLQIESPLQA